MFNVISYGCLTNDLAAARSATQDEGKDMIKTGAQLVQEIKANIKEVSVTDLEQQLTQAQNQTSSRVSHHSTDAYADHVFDSHDP